MTTKSPQLFAPASYWNATPAEKSRGLQATAGRQQAGWKGKISSPDSIAGA